MIDKDADVIADKNDGTPLVDQQGNLVDANICSKVSAKNLKKEIKTVEKTLAEARKKKGAAALTEEGRWQLEDELTALKEKLAAVVECGM